MEELNSESQTAASGSATASPEVENVQKLIQESKAAIEADQGGPIPIRRGRGRPRKVPVPTPQPQAVQTQAAVQAPTTAPEVDLTPQIAHGLVFIGEAASEAYDFEGFRVKDEERDLLAPQIDAVLKQYIPDFAKSPHAAAFTLAGSLVFIAGSKAFQYRLHLKNKVDLAQKEAQKAAEIPPADPFNPFPVTQFQ